MTQPTHTLTARTTIDTPVAAALLMSMAMALTVGLALGFEHIGGYLPCKLCLEQRMPYYIGAPLMLLTAYAGAAGAPASLIRIALLVGAAIAAFSLYLGVKHTGVEYGWWAGPTDCGAVVAPAGGGGQGVLDQLNTIIPPSCDKAAWRDPVLRLSFAGWNAIISAALLLVALRGALSRSRT
jgi:disulfide bond formation protein DsbB